MTFDMYPDPPTAPLTVRRGEPSELIELTARAAVDPVTGRDMMYLALVKLAVDGTPPGPPDPVVRLRVDTGPLTQVSTGTPLPTAPGIDEPAAVATLSRTATPDVYLVEIEVLRAGRTWSLQIENSGPADTHSFTWVVADNIAETRQPWIDAPATTLDYTVDAGARQTRTIAVANNGTGPLALTDPDHMDLRQGFVLDTIAPRTIAPGSSATARITFTGPATPGSSSADYPIASNDTAARTQPGHNQLVRLVATTHQPPPPPLVDSIEPTNGHPEDMFTIFGQNLVLQSGDDVEVLFFGPQGADDPDQQSIPASVSQPTHPGGVTARVPEITSHHDHEIYGISLTRGDGQRVTVIDDFFVAIL
jgi:hypothetical protein